ncbi:MAG: hypothetical protein KH347_05550 [Acetobacter sp.]|nr:hypothetical protein [Acetobacter sp.]
MQTIMLNDFLDSSVHGIFTTLCGEKNEMIIIHNKSQIRVKLLRGYHTLVAEMFTEEHGWIEIQNKKSVKILDFSPLTLAHPLDAEAAAEMESSLEDYRKFAGLLFLKKLAIVLGENPEDLDNIIE